MCTNCPWELPLWNTSINDITGPAAAGLTSEMSMNPVEYNGFISHTWDMLLGVNPAYNGVLYRVRLLQ